MRRTMLFAAAVLGLTAAFAEADDPVLQIGTLVCDLQDKTNFVVVSSSTYACTFTNNDGNTAEFTGTIEKVGIDISYDLAQQFRWLVLAPSIEQDPDALAGRYAGASVNVAALAGAGLRLLIGGSNEQIALQPVSTAGHEGFGAALGIESFTLEAK